MGVDVFSLTGALTDSNICVNNKFSESLVNLAINAYKNNLLVSIQTGNSKGTKYNVNIANMPAMVNQNFSTIKGEIANYRYQHCGVAFSPLFDIQKNEDILFIDYLLSMCLCYVEIDNPSYNPNSKYSQRVDKFFATRNINIVKALCGGEDSKLQKANVSLQMIEQEYKSNMLRLIKVNETKKGYSMTQPRNAVSMGKNVRIMPVVLLMALGNVIQAQLMQHIMEFTFVKDDKSVRVLNSTLNPMIFASYYNDNDRWEEVKSNITAKYTRGYIKVPELGLSRYDESGVRSLNLVRLEKMRIVQEVDKSFIDVDINSIAPAFKMALDEMLKNGYIVDFYHAFLNTNKVVSPVEGWNELNNYIDSQVAIGTTTFLRYLHNFMMKNKDYFPKYTGEKITSSNYSSGLGFTDLGV